MDKVTPDNTRANWVADADRGGGSRSTDSSAQSEFGKALNQEAQKSSHVGHTGHAPAFSFGVSTKKVPPLNIKLEVKKEADKRPEPKLGMEAGSGVVKTTGKETEVGVKVLPFVTLAVEGGNPKVAVEAGVKRKIGSVDVEAKAKLEGKFRVLDNSDPYSAGTVEVKGEAKVKAGPAEAGIKDKLLSFPLRFGMGGTSDKIQENRQRLADQPELGDAYTAQDAHTNIKVELQNDPTVTRKPQQSSSLMGIWKAFKHLGEDSVYDGETGESIYKSDDQKRYYEVLNRSRD